MTHDVLSESILISPKRAGKKASPTTFNIKNKHGGAVRRIVYFHPQEIERSLQGNVSALLICRVSSFDGMRGLKMYCKYRNLVNYRKM